MTPDNFFQGLSKRNFCGLDGGIFSMGRCHTPDKKHYVLLTDGLVIYSSIPYYDQVKHFPNEVTITWAFDEFKFEDLDKLITETYLH